MNKFFLPALGLAMMALAACSGGDRVVLMADPDGHVGRIQVSSAGGTQVLDQEKTASNVATAKSAPTAAKPVEEQEIRKVWGRALAAMPPRPQTFLLYFKTGGSDLRDESKPEVTRITDVLRDWPHPHVLVAGHADGTGSDEINIKVSRERADAVRDMLVKMGVPSDAIEATSHGKRNPLVKVPDGTAEPRNRRVSVTIQ
ncbi:OmpA family protein [Magnetospirillum aberrantis]|uniref:OmpA family protein n=1 Tax=Magnetospirillum aberrantis SpK TaxID=908842 RepID=A0A7C9QW00_9PROT|nr:OmpA family protein [Magnetospirillum aberrantis]NFV81983.1 OmpA family protein [Magnetospirillum aberrantis SpK]